MELDADWEEGLPWMLLAIREVTQESIGFSPNELVFGHVVRGPTAVLADEWHTSKPPDNIIDYVSGFRRRLYEARAIAQKKLVKSQVKMQQLFDRKAKSRSFQVGDRVLALLSLPNNPFQAKFTGPYSIAKRLSNNNYMLNTPDRRRKVQVCHINLLKSFVDPVSTASVGVVTQCDPSNLAQHPVVVASPSCSTCDEFSNFDEDGNLHSRGKVDGRLDNSKILADLLCYLSYLDKGKRNDVIGLITSFPSLFLDTPGRTSIIEHDIEVGNSSPIKQNAYRVNPVKRELLKQEVDYLLTHSLAEPSFSSWSSPCLLVNEPDGSYRFCTDYRKLNSLTKPDCFPLPRVDDCVDHVGSAQYVSKFDLLKGYWQVPLTARAK